MDTRKAEHSDLAQVSVLFDAYRQFYGQESDLDGSTDFIRERLASKDSEILLAVSEDKVVGFAQLYPSFSSVSMKRVFILNDLFVSPDVRKRGAGTALLKAAERFAPRANFSRHATSSTTACDRIARWAISRQRRKRCC